MDSAGAAENPAKRGHAIFMSALDHPARISPFLWFDGNAEEAVDFYLSVFKKSRKLSELRNPGAKLRVRGAGC